VLGAPPTVLAAEALDLHHAHSPRSQKARQSGSVASRGLDPEADRLPEAQSPLQQVLVTAIVVRYEHLAPELPQLIERNTHMGIRVGVYPDGD
jgi:hypothetical protein